MAVGAGVTSRLLLASLVSLRSVVSAMSEVSESVPPVDMAESRESRTGSRTGRNWANNEAGPGGGGVPLDESWTTRGAIIISRCPHNPPEPIPGPGLGPNPREFCCCDDEIDEGDADSP
jgi:hypothetical protein